MHPIISALEAILGPIFGSNVHTKSDRPRRGPAYRDGITVDLPDAVFTVTVGHGGRRTGQRPQRLLMSYVTADGTHDHMSINPDAEQRRAWALRFIELHRDSPRDGEWRQHSALTLSTSVANG